VRGRGLSLCGYPSSGASLSSGWMGNRINRMDW
jgi:hypothetical protein